MNRTPFLLALAIAGLLILTGCGSSSPGISIQLVNVPGTLTVNQSVSLTATVSNDTNNGGVNWTCSPSGSCGAFNPAQTANGATTEYTAPSAPGTVMITATAVDSSSATTTESVSVVPVSTSTLPQGNYVFFVSGTDSNGPYIASGTIVADGNGNITGGEQDYVDAGDVEAGPDTVSGNYSVSSGGSGSITLNVSDITLPNNGVETFSIATTSSTHALIIEFDGTATSSGTLDFQSASALSAGSIAGSYSFVSNGYDISNQVGFMVGGVANLNAATGFITSGAIWANDGGTGESSPTNTGPVTGPDQFGRGTMETTFGLNFVYYAVQGEVLRIIEEDSPDFIGGGAFYGQGANGTNASFSNSSLTGTYVFFDSGSTVNGPLALVGQFTADGSGDFSAGYADTDDGGTYEKGSIAGTAVYSIAGNGTGTLTLPGTPSTTEDVSALVIFATDPALNLYDPNNTSGGGGALILDYDSGAFGTGYIVPQTSGTFSGNYATNLQFFNTAGEEDFVGQTAASGSSLTGTVDLNDDGVTAPATTFSGSYSADTTNTGRYTGSFTVGSNSYNITYYQVSAGELFIMDTDSSDLGNGFMETQ